jgi:hypothetical protein
MNNMVLCFDLSARVKFESERKSAKKRASERACSPSLNEYLEVAHSHPPFWKTHYQSVLPLSTTR